MAKTSHWSPLIESPALRFSLKHLLLGMAVIAVALVALRNASGAWSAALLATAQLALAVSILLVVFRRGAARAYWLGFGVFGWLYMLLVIVSWVGHSPDTDTPIEAHNLATRQLSNVCYHWLFDNAFEQYAAQYPAHQYQHEGVPPSGAFFAPGSAPPLPLPPAPPPPGPDEQDFSNVAHALWTLFLALCGGQLAKWLYATQGRTSEHRDVGGN